MNFSLISVQGGILTVTPNPEVKKGKIDIFYNICLQLHLFKKMFYL